MQTLPNPATRIDPAKPFEAVDAPASAFTLPAAAVQFATKGDEQDNSKRGRILARTGDPIEHWYWGRIVHDFEGMQVKDRIALDWLHDCDEVVGFAENFDYSSGDLFCDGQIESLAVGDEADKIIKRSARGIPYEASIDFDGFSAVYEWLGEDLLTTVNGREIEGPCVIVRRWELRRVAICPSGADSGTRSQFANANAADRFAINWKDSEPMTKKSDAGKPENKPENPETPADKLSGDNKPATDQKTVETSTTTETQKPDESEFAARLDKFTTKFGAVDGLEYFKAGISYADALEKHADKLAAELKSRDAKVSELSTKLSQVDLGEASAVETSPAAGNGTQAKNDFATNFTAARKTGYGQPNSGR